MRHEGCYPAYYPGRPQPTVTHAEEQLQTPEAPSLVSADVVVIIVAFRKPGDVVDCLRALARSRAQPSFAVFIAENGGAAATRALHAAIVGEGGPCRVDSSASPPVPPEAADSCRCFRLLGEGGDGAPERRVIVAGMAANLGYAAGVNAWLRPLLRLPGWRGAWILNPDTQPTPTALAELVAYARTRGRGMIGGRLTPIASSDRIHSRGLAWRKLPARTLAVDYHATSEDPDADDVERRLDAPSGASLYVTRELMERIGLMDERYFLFFEDLEWGCRAKAVGAIGYAHRSVVPHKGGSTVRSAGPRGERSRLAVYLEFRNRILFVRATQPAWLPWTALMQALHATTFGLSGSTANFRYAMKGLLAGLRGEVGRPENIADHECDG